MSIQQNNQNRTMQPYYLKSGLCADKFISAWEAELLNEPDWLKQIREQVAQPKFPPRRLLGTETHRDTCAPDRLSILKRRYSVLEDKYNKGDYSICPEAWQIVTDSIIQRGKIRADRKRRDKAYVERLAFF